MLKMSHKTLIIISGLIWLAVGSFLLPLGLNFLMSAAENVRFQADQYPLLNLLMSLSPQVENAIIFLISAGLLVGFFKGRFVLGKSAYKGVERIRNFSDPTEFKNIYSAKYYILLACMMGLGFSMKYLGIPADVRGFIDVAIGAALINGAMVYFRLAFEKKHAVKS
ncbi:MAG: hypothetical protein BGO14_05785 [Chlamydiales bacterium 38-26]|nr:hypothetical protein [Chlamydiales bacterium]OJV08407.1 MAG: hypothetical protein BGO14_05785 [Chlamydiales bacterium 38-26]